MKESDKPFLTGDAYEFYTKFKECEKQGVITNVSVGRFNQRITVHNGHKLMEYRGKEVKKLIARINRRIAEHGEIIKY